MKTAGPWHPFLFAAFPVLFLYAHNAGELSPGVMVLPLIGTLLLAALALGAGALALRDGARGALLASVSLLLFLSHGHVHNLLGATVIPLGPVQLGPNRLAILLLGGLFLVALVALIRRRTPVTGVSRGANLLGGVLVIGALVQIGIAEISTPSETGAGLAPEDEQWIAQRADASDPLPHIFYIILDAYGEASMLMDRYGLDNRALVAALEDRGFRVIANGRSNYPQTTLSLASSLGLEYLDDLAARMGRESEDRQPLRQRIKQSRVAHVLRRLGYTYVAFATGYYPTEARNADLFLSPGPTLNDFQSELLNTTPLPALLRAMGGGTQTDMHRRRILYALDHLPDVLDLETPAFVLAHIICPHPPFVFGASGESRQPQGRFTMADGSDLITSGGITAEDYRSAYRDQLRFLNTRLLPALDRLLTEADRPVIIVIQGDHGPGAGLDFEDGDATDIYERFSVLNAYHFPDQDYGQLGDEITPVNTFRVIFNQYFGGRFERLPNRSYFATETHPYALEDVTDRVFP